MSYMKVIYGKLHNRDKYAFEGINTHRNVKWYASGDSYYDIYHKLYELNVIDSYDGDPVELYLLGKLDKTYEDYSINDEVDFDQIYKDGEKYLTDEAYREIISSERGNAYYQKWFMWNEEDLEFLEV